MRRNLNTIEPEHHRESFVTRVNMPENTPTLNAFYLYITNGCNLFCKHCWITPRFVNGEPSPGDYLDLDLLKIAVSDGKTLGLNQAKLTGGEPLLHPKLKEMTEYLSNEDIKLTMETNCTLVDAEMAKHFMKNTTIRFISTSLDSPDPISHDQFRGKQGTFNKTIKGIEHLVNVGYRPQIIMSPHRRNIHEVEDLVKLAIKIGAGSVKFNPVTPTGRGAKMEENGETLDFDETMRLVHYVRGELQEKYKIKLFISCPPALSSIKEILREKEVGGACRVLNILGILGNGEMALCGIGRNIPELCFGRLGQDNLRETWINHPTLVKLRKDLKGNLPGICGHCIHAKRCLTHCVAMNYVQYGELVNPSYLCDQAEKKGIFPIIRKKEYENTISSDDKY